jgi:hypothetical protein
MSDVHDLIRRARELAALADKATPGPWRAAQAKSGPFKLPPWWYVMGLPVDGPSTGGDYYSEADAKLVATSPDMAHLLAEMADELEQHRQALTIIAQELDGWGDVDLHEEAFLIALDRDPSYEDGSRDPEPNDYTQALLKAVLGMPTRD